MPHEIHIYSLYIKYRLISIFTSKKGTVFTVKSGKLLPYGASSTC